MLATESVSELYAQFTSVDFARLFIDSTGLGPEELVGVVGFLSTGTSRMMNSS